MPPRLRQLALAAACMVPVPCALAQDPVPTRPNVLASPEWQQFVLLVQERASHAPDIEPLAQACVAATFAPPTLRAPTEVDRCLEAAVRRLPDQAGFEDAEDTQFRLASATPRPFGSIGIEIQGQVRATGAIIVGSPLGDSPAERAGIRPGDLIDHIGGVDISGMPLKDAMLLFHGKPGTPLEVSLLRGEPPRRITLTVPLEIIHPGPVTAWLAAPDVVYARIWWFNDETPAQLVQALQRAAAGEHDRSLGLVLDLRHCAGGPLPTVLASLGWLLPEHRRAGWARTRQDMLPLEVAAPPISQADRAAMRLYRTPMILLTDVGTKAGAELFADVLRRQRGATILGERSGGVTAINLGKTLANGATVWITEGEMLALDESSWKGVGLEPDRLVVSNYGRWALGGPTDQVLAEGLRQAAAQPR